MPTRYAQSALQASISMLLALLTIHVQRRVGAWTPSPLCSRPAQTPTVSTAPPTSPAAPAVSLLQTPSTSSTRSASSRPSPASDSIPPDSHSSPAETLSVSTALPTTDSVRSATPTLVSYSDRDSVCSDRPPAPCPPNRSLWCGLGSCCRRVWPRSSSASPSEQWSLPTASQTRWS